MTTCPDCGVPFGRPTPVADCHYRHAHENSADAAAAVAVDGTMVEVDLPDGTTVRWAALIDQTTQDSLLAAITAVLGQPDTTVT